MRARCRCRASTQPHYLERVRVRSVRSAAAQAKSHQRYIRRHRYCRRRVAAMSPDAATMFDAARILAVIVTSRHARCVREPLRDIYDAPRYALMRGFHVRRRCRHDATPAAAIRYAADDTPAPRRHADDALR